MLRLHKNRGSLFRSHQMLGSTLNITYSNCWNCLVSPGLAAKADSSSHPIEGQLGSDVWLSCQWFLSADSQPVNATAMLSISKYKALEVCHAYTVFGAFSEARALALGSTLNITCCYYWNCLASAGLTAKTDSSNNPGKWLGFGCLADHANDFCLMTTTAADMQRSSDALAAATVGTV